MELNLGNNLWYSFRYLNTLLSNYFLFIKYFDDPYPVFFSLFFRNIIKNNNQDKINYQAIQSFLDFLKLDRNYSLGKYLKKEVLFYLSNLTYVKNDLGITEKDFNLFNDILLTVQPVQVKSNVYCGMFFEEIPSLSFRFKRR